MTRHIAFIGKQRINAREKELLQTLGAFMAQGDYQLHTALRPGACMAVVEGYQAAGGDPEIHKSKLHQAAPQVLAYSDSPLRTQLDTVRKETHDQVEWLLLDTTEALEAVLDAAAFYLDQQDALT